MLSACHCLSMSWEMGINTMVQIVLRFIWNGSIIAVRVSFSKLQKITQLWQLNNENGNSITKASSSAKNWYVNKLNHHILYMFSACLISKINMCSIKFCFTKTFFIGPEEKENHWFFVGSVLNDNILHGQKYINHPSYVSVQ